MLIQDIKPPIKRQLRRVQKKTVEYWQWLNLFVRTSKYGVAIFAVVVLALGAGVVALNAPEVNMTKAVPSSVSGDWQNASAVTELNLGDSAQSPEFSRKNSAYTYAEFAELNLPTSTTDNLQQTPNDANASSSYENTKQYESTKTDSSTESISPIDTEAIGSKQQATSTDTESAPPDEEVIPPASEEITPPAEQTAPPAEETAPTAEPSTPPAETTLPPAEPTPPPATESNAPGFGRILADWFLRVVYAQDIPAETNDSQQTTNDEQPTTDNAEQAEPTADEQQPAASNSTTPTSDTDGNFGSTTPTADGNANLTMDSTSSPQAPPVITPNLDSGLEQQDISNKQQETNTEGTTTETNDLQLTTDNVIAASGTPRNDTQPQPEYSVYTNRKTMLLSGFQLAQELDA